MEHHWSPVQAILFGSEKPFKRVCITRPCFVLMVTSEKDHLIIIERFVRDKNIPFVSEKSSMDGFIIPWTCFTSLDIKLNAFSIRDINKNKPISTYGPLNTRKVSLLEIMI
ncbi:unnamed protein product [Onchocerca flexuosa]|uniref:Transcriptional regulator n=1 Tax=Onchocerca flexuosa TaxID=387005 RepID=A0A183HS50_9BILA|nr:unnamed protein product [Onchocerca flexuosa]